MVTNYVYGKIMCDESVIEMRNFVKNGSEVNDLEFLIVGVMDSLIKTRHIGGTMIFLILRRFFLKRHSH